MSELTGIQRPDGDSCPAFVATPEGAPRGGIVVIQEWWGLNEQIKKTANRFAEQGLLAIVPDLYRGKLAGDADEANHMMGSLNFMDAAKQDISGCIAHLRNAGCAKVAVTGFCMGGALTLLSAVHSSAFDVAVCFYGIPPEEAADLSRIKMPLQCHFATQDDWCTPAAVDGLEARLRGGNVSYEIHRYEAQHAFMNEARPEVHNAECARLAWDRANAFINSALS